MGISDRPGGATRSRIIHSFRRSPTARVARRSKAGHLGRVLARKYPGHVKLDSINNRAAGTHPGLRLIYKIQDRALS